MQKNQQIPSSSPFGLDTYPSAPHNLSVMHMRGDTLPGYSKRATTSPTTTAGAHNVGQLGPTESSESLYQASAWAKLWFLRLMILTVTRLMLFISKIYQDYTSTLFYMRKPSYFGHFLISFSTLFLPTIIFTTYRVARYLQVHVYPRFRWSEAETRAPPGAGYQQQSPSSPADARRDSWARSTPITQIEDGLVTARESPNPDDSYLNQSNQHQLGLSDASSLAPSTAIVKDHNTTNWFDESSRDLPANQSIPNRRQRPVVLGIGEQFLHGILYVFWQLKRQVDVVGFLVERACLWRKPRPDEQAQLQKLQLGSDGLEWFQDFYAAFLAILVQVYTLGLQWAPKDTANEIQVNSTTIIPVSSPQQQHPSDSLGKDGFSSALKVAQRNTTGTGVNLVSRVAHLAGASVEETDLLIMSQLVISSAIVVSLLMAVRRRDDGPLTLLLSMIGWGSLFASRIIVLALAVFNLGSFTVFIFTLCHILLITGWIYKIAIDSHNNKPGESEEFEWNDEENELKSATGSPEPLPAPLQTEVTSNWFAIERLTLLVQVFILFAIPSVFYWPIMFNLKLHCRPFKFLVLMMSQNFILIATILFINRNTTELYLLAGAGGLAVTGFIFISLYHCCKPSLTEYFARADELFNEADRSGVYFEFCSRVFKMPDLSKQCFRRLMNQRTEIVERES